MIHNQFVIMNENQLHSKVVSYIRRFYPDVLTTAPMGSLQDTASKRVQSYKHGYTAGSSDLIILEPNHHYNVMSIEFKTPNGKGVISDRQHLFATKMKNRGSKHIISDDYDLIIRELNEYLSTRRICCHYCIRKFKTEYSMLEHLKHFHRNI